jgi:ribose transport system substrate-binding protein
MKKSILLFMSMVVVVSFVAACSSAAPAAPTAKPASAPAAAQPTSAAAAQSTPVAAPTKGAAATGKTANIALVSGGPHPYFDPWKTGLADAIKDFGLKGEFRAPQEWTLNAQNQLIDSMVSQGFNAFGIFPGDVNGTNGKIDELAAKGIPSLDLAGPTNQPTKAYFCLTTDVAESAYLGTKALIKAMGGKGKIMHGTGFLVDPNTQLRENAVKKAVDETNGAVTLVQTLADIDDQEKADKAINSFLAANKDKVDGIITTAYIPSVVAATALRNLGDKRIKMVGIDTDPVVLNAIKDGFVYGTMAQNPYGQAYVGSYVLNRLVQGYKKKADAPWKVDSGTFLITSDTVATYMDELKPITQKLKEQMDGYLVAP